MYFCIEKCFDKKALQGPVTINFPNSALVVSFILVSIYPPRGKALLSNARFDFVIFLEVK